MLLRELVVWLIGEQGWMGWSHPCISNQRPLKTGQHISLSPSNQMEQSSIIYETEYTLLFYLLNKSGFELRVQKHARHFMETTLLFRRNNQQSYLMGNEIAFPCITMLFEQTLRISFQHHTIILVSCPTSDQTVAKAVFIWSSPFQLEMLHKSSSRISWQWALVSQPTNYLHQWSMPRSRRGWPRNWNHPSRQ